MKGDPQEVFRQLQDNMRTSFNTMTRGLLPKLQVAPDSKTELEEYPSQVLLMADKLLWTQIT